MSLYSSEHHLKVQPKASSEKEMFLLMLCKCVHIESLLSIDMRLLLHRHEDFLILMRLLLLKQKVLFPNI